MQELLSLDYFALFLIIVLGFLFGQVRIKGASLGTSAVIFVALMMGHWGVQLPSSYQYLGLILFIFTIGIQSGPGFFKSFKEEGRKMIALAFLLITLSLLITVSCLWLFQIDKNLMIGIFTGALSSTPGLAAAIEITQTGTASIGYGVAYPFGVVGVILFVKFSPLFSKKSIKEIEQELEEVAKSEYSELKSENFRVSNKSVFYKTLKELNFRTITDANISRIYRNNQSIPIKPEIQLLENDIVRVVGLEESIDKVAIFLGEKTEEEIPNSSENLVESVLVTNSGVVNKTIGSLNMLRNYNAQIVKIRRSGIDIPASLDSKIQFGDKLLVTVGKYNIENIRQLFGNDQRRMRETDFFPIALGIVLGILLGFVKLSFSDNFTFSLGLTGGVLIAAMVLSGIGKTGPIIWTMSGTANKLLREFGLLLFLAVVGVNSGAHLLETLQTHGLQLVLSAVLIVTLPMLITLFVGQYILKINLLAMLGVITGSMTSTPGLASADSMTETNAPSVAYAAVYPFALVLMILGVQLLNLL